MSDRTNFTLVVYECPEEQREAIVEIIRREYLSPDFMGGSERVNELELGQVYGDECQLTAYVDIGVEIAEAAPGALFECWSDPKYEWVGEKYMYTPELGAFVHTCNEDGSLTFSEQEVEEALGIEDADTRAKFLGKPWNERLHKQEATVG